MVAVASRRRPLYYRPYRRRNFNWEPLYYLLNHHVPQQVVADAFKIPQQTLSDHYSKYRRARETDNQTLLAEALGRSDGRKRSHRALSDAAEQEVYEEYSSALRHNKAFTGGNLASAALRAYRRDHPYWTRSTGRTSFSAASDFRRRFERDHHIRHKLVRKRHRPNTYPDEERLWTEATTFFEKVNMALERCSPAMVVNMDETSLKVVMTPRQGLGNIGGGPLNVVHKTKAKTAVTMVVAITASGRKLRPALLVKGKTNRSVTKFKLPKLIEPILCDKGWMDGNVMIEWIDQILLPYADGRQCVLIVDDLPAHQTPRVRRHLREHNVELILVPGWLTADYQPLDVGFFGPLKSIMSALWRHRMLIGDDQTDSLAGMIQNFVAAYNGIPSLDVRRAFRDAGITSVADSPGQ